MYILEKELKPGIEIGSIHKLINEETFMMSLLLTYLDLGKAGPSYSLVLESLFCQTGPVHTHTGYPPDRT